MGMYAQFDDVHHGTQPFDLADECTACHGTGWVPFATNVTVGDEEWDKCPRGCEPLDMNTIRDNMVREEAALEEALLPAFYASFQNEGVRDPFLTMAKQWRMKGKGATLQTPHKAACTVSSDTPVAGLLEDGDRVTSCLVPPYLVGTPIEVTKEYTTIRYEYMGSYVNIRFSKAQAIRLRFAYSWDNDYSSYQLMQR